MGGEVVGEVRDSRQPLCSECEVSKNARNRTNDMRCEKQKALR